MVNRRRSVLKALVAGGTLSQVPQEWFRPIVETVVLPAHAQTSPSEDDDSDSNGGPNCEFMYSTTLGYNLPMGDGNIPDQMFEFDLDGLEPCDDGTVTISNLAGDAQFPGTEQWTIWLGPVGTGVNLGLTNLTPDECVGIAPDNNFPVSVQQLADAVSGNSITINAVNGGSIEDSCETNTMNVTLEFPASPAIGP